MHVNNYTGDYVKKHKDFATTISHALQHTLGV